MLRAVQCTASTCVQFDTSYFHNNYVLINAATCFGLNCWPSSGSPQVFSVCCLFVGLCGRNSVCDLNCCNEYSMLHFLKSIFVVKIQLNIVKPFKAYWLRALTGLTLKNYTFFPQCIYLLCIYLRTNSDLCPI
jgi:hypothetical protein